MAGVPYLCLFVVGFRVYLALRRKRLAEEAASRQADGTPSPTGGFGPAADGRAPLLS